MLERTRHYATAQKRDLTSRQQEVLRMIAAGRTNAEIADSLGITLDGAKFHVREILGKLGVDSREEAAEWWRERDGLSARAGRSLRALLPAGWLKMSLAAAGVVGLVVGTVVLTVALNGGSGGAPDALAALEDLPACDLAELKWTTAAELDADPAIGARFTLSARNAEECVLSGDFEVAYGGSVAGARPLQGGSVIVTVAGQRIATADSVVIVGSASNVCGSNLSVLALLSQGVGVYRLDSPSPPCLDATLPANVTAMWAAARNAGTPVALAPQSSGTVCDHNDIEWTVNSTPETRIGDGVSFTVSATSPVRCQLFASMSVDAWGGTPQSGGGAVMVRQTPQPAVVPLIAVGLGPQPTEVLAGVVRNQCNTVEDTMLILLTSVQRSYWLNAPPPACTDFEGSLQLEVHAVPTPGSASATPSPTSRGSTMFCDAFLGTCPDGSVRGPAAYRVQPGDTLAAIATKTGYTEQQLRDANLWLDSTALYAGMVVRLPVALPPSSPPPPGDVLRICDHGRGECEDLRVLEPYTVQPGDTLSSLSVRFAIDQSALRIVNADVDFDALTPGTIIRVPK